MKDKDIVNEITAKNPEKIKVLELMFDTYIQKIQIFHSYYKADKKITDDAVKNVTEFLIGIKSSYIEQWCIGEKSIDIVNYLEKHIIELGGDIALIRDNFSKNRKRGKSSTDTEHQKKS